MDIINLTINIKFCRISYHEKDWVERKTKCDYTVWNIISGGLALQINDQTLYAKEGDVLLFHPGDTYKAWCHDDDHCYFLVTFFSISSGNVIDILTQESTAGLYTNDFVKEISIRFCDEYTTCHDNEDTHNLKLYAAFLNFFADLSSQFGEQLPFHTSSDSVSDQRLHSLLDFISKHVESNLTVREMAEFMSMSEKYFSGYFHFHIGMSPKQYLTKCRMTHAIQLLSDPDNSISEIASRLHFSDQYSFTKSFKKYYGETPGKFRKQHFYVHNAVTSSEYL